MACLEFIYIYNLPVPIRPSKRCLLFLYRGSAVSWILLLVSFLIVPPNDILARDFKSQNKQKLLPFLQLSLVLLLFHFLSLERMPYIYRSQRSTPFMGKSIININSDGNFLLSSARIIVCLVQVINYIVNIELFLL